MLPANYLQPLRSLFYALAISIAFLPKFSGGLGNFDGNQLGEATLNAVDIQSRVSEMYFFVAVVLGAFLLFYVLFSKLISNKLIPSQSLEYSLLFAGILQAISAFFNPSLGALLAFPIAFHVVLLGVQYLKLEIAKEHIYTAIAFTLIFWLLVIWLLPLVFSPIIHGFLLSGVFASTLYLTSKYPNFKLGSVVNSIAFLSFLPFIITELNYIFREKAGSNINGIILSLILLILSSLKIIITYKKSTAAQQTTARSWLFIALGMGIQTFYQPYGWASTELFELANRATPLMELHFFHQLPLLEKASSHLVSDYGFGLIYQAIYGYHGLDFMVFDIFETLAWITFAFILIYQLTENKLAAFYFVAFFPFFDASLTPYYAFSFLPLIWLIEAFKNNSQRAAWLFGISFTILFPWRADLSFALLISTIFLVSFGIYLKRFRLKFLLPTLLSMSLLGLFLLSIAFINNIDWISSLKSTIDYLQSSQSYGLTNLGDQTGNQFIFHHFIIPMLVLGVFILALKKSSHSFGNQSMPIIVTVIYLSVFYFVNLPRGIVRHGFAEGFDNFLDSYAPFILILWISYALVKQKSLRFWAFILGLVIFQLFLRHPNRSPENGLALAGIKTPFHHEKIPFNHQSKRLKIDTTNLRENIIPMVNFLRGNLKDGETFLDFGNTPMLYFYAEKPVPAFFYQSPQNVHSISLQRDWINRMANYKIPLFLFRHHPKEWWDATDGVPNELRHYLIAEYAYKNYFPLQQVAGYEVWVSKKKNHKELPEFMQARLYEYMNLQKLPAVWNPPLMNIEHANFINDTLAINDPDFHQSKLCISNKQNNWIILNVNNTSTSDALLRITLMQDIYPFGGYDFTVNSMTEGSYKIRLSMLPSWWFRNINYIRILLPKGLVIEDVTFASDSN